MTQESPEDRIEALTACLHSVLEAVGCCPLERVLDMPSEYLPEMAIRARQTIQQLRLEKERFSAENARLMGELEDAKMGYCPMCDVVGGCIHDSEGEE